MWIEAAFLRRARARDARLRLSYPSHSLQRLLDSHTRSLQDGRGNLSVSYEPNPDSRPPRSPVATRRLDCHSLAAARPRAPGAESGSWQYCCRIQARRWSSLHIPGLAAAILDHRAFHLSTHSALFRTPPSPLHPARFVMLSHSIDSSSLTTRTRIPSVGCLAT